MRLLELLDGGTVNLEGIGRDEDSYGRKLRRVLVNGKSVGVLWSMKGWPASIAVGDEVGAEFDV